jgi:hypothetical protein
MSSYLRSTTLGKRFLTDQARLLCMLVLPDDRRVFAQEPDRHLEYDECHKSTADPLATSP